MEQEVITIFFTLTATPKGGVECTHTFEACRVQGNTTQYSSTRCCKIIEIQAQ